MLSAIIFATFISGAIAASCTEDAECGTGQQCIPLEYGCHNHYLGECRERSPWCTQEYSPVCSCSGISYSTECHAYAAGERIRAAGTCQNDDSATLGFNAATAARQASENNNNLNVNGGVGGANVEGGARASGLGGTGIESGSDNIAAQSASRSGAGVGVGGGEGATCGTDADCIGTDDRAVYAGVGRNQDPPFCKYPVGSCEVADAIATSAAGGQTTENESGGVCTFKPLGCPRNFHPVCGCNGVTYPNACGAASAGVNVRAEGECAPGAEEARQEDEKSWGTEGLSWNNRQGLGEATDNAADPRVQGTAGATGAAPTGAFPQQPMWAGQPLDEAPGQQAPSAPGASHPAASPQVRDTPLVQQLKREEEAAARGAYEFGTEFNGLPRVPQAPQAGGQPQAPDAAAAQSGVAISTDDDRNVTARLEHTRNMTANATGAFVPLLQNLTNATASVGQQTSNLTTSGLEGAAGAASAGKNATSGFFRGVGEAIGGAINATVGTIGSAWNAARNATGGLVNTTTSTVETAVNATRNATGILLNATTTVAGTAFNATRNATSGFVNATGGAVDSAKNVTSNLTSTLGNAAGNATSGVQNFTSGAVNATRDAAGRLINNTQGALGGAWNATANATVGAWNATAGAAGTAWNATLNVTGQAGGLLQNATNATLNATTTWYNRTVEGMTGLQNQTVNATNTLYNRTVGAANITLEALRNATGRYNLTSGNGVRMNATVGPLGNTTSNTTFNNTLGGTANTTLTTGGGRILRGPCTARNASIACGGGMFCRFEEGKCSGTETGPRAALAVAEDEGDVATGQCARKPLACDRRYEPVCGCDGRTHASQCEAEFNGVSVKHDGTCEANAESEGSPCVTAGDCGEGFACVAEDGVCEEASAPGAATIMRGATTVQQQQEEEAQRRFDAEDARVRQQRLDEQIRRQEPEDEYPRAQLYSVGVGGTGSKKCVRTPTECSDAGQGLEVCGCDGQTYPSRCAAHSVGITVKHTRSCEEGDGGVDQNGAEDLGGRPGQAWRVEGAGARGELEPTPSGEEGTERTPERSVDWDRDQQGEDEDIVDSSRTRNLHIQRTRTGDADLDRTRDVDLDRTRDADLDRTRDADLDRTRDADLDRTRDADLDRTRDVEERTRDAGDRTRDAQERTRDAEGFREEDRVRDIERTRDEESDERDEVERTKVGLGATGANSRFGTRVPRRTATPGKQRSTSTPRMSTTSTTTPRVPDDVGSHKEFVDWADRERVFAYAAPDAAWREALQKKLEGGKGGAGGSTTAGGQSTGSIPPRDRETGDLSDELATARPICEEIECGAAAECVASGRCSRCFRCSDAPNTASSSTNIESTNSDRTGGRDLNTRDRALTPEEQLEQKQLLAQQERDRELLLNNRDLSADEQRAVRGQNQAEQDLLRQPSGFVPGSVPYYDSTGAGVEVLDGGSASSTTASAQRGDRSGVQLEASQDADREKMTVGTGTTSSASGSKGGLEKGAVGVVCESDTFEDAVECFKMHACKGLIGSGTRCVIGGRTVNCPKCDDSSGSGSSGTGGGKDTLVEEVVVIDERGVGVNTHPEETEEPQWSKLLTVGIAVGVLVAAVTALVVAVVLLARRAIRADAANASWASHFARINSGNSKYTDPTGDNGGTTKPGRAGGGGVRGARGGGFTDSSTVPVTSPLKEPRGVSNL